jgi:aspartate/tyrosine/aromatic aminotransferase
MFETFELAPPDSILGLNEAFRKDSNPQKINLSVGVYQDESGRTPILQSVKAAERRLLDEEQSKSYLSIDGLASYDRLVQELLFGPSHELIASRRAVTLQAPGGTGALRVAADLLKRKLPTARVWCSQPTWANHHSIFQAADRQVGTYAYLDPAGTGLDFAALKQSLESMSPGDAVVLHGCCHNPTGIDPSLEQWREIAALLAQRRLLPIVDLAYQGLGEGLETDVAGLRAICREVHEVLVCSSYSKNFGLYSERVGALTIVAGSHQAAEAALSHAKICVRTNYSNPPQHGAAIVATILGDAALRKLWEGELAEMRERIHTVRHQFVAKMKVAAPQHDFSFIERQKGMFSFTRLTPLQVDQLRTEYAIYVVSAGGRMNVAGLTSGNLSRVCDAIAAVL